LSVSLDQDVAHGSLNLNGDGSLSVNRVETPAFRQAVFNTTLGFRSGQAVSRR
jgi:hypothetical protein